MGHAREVMDRITNAVVSGDEASLRQLYAPNAVAETPDAGRVEGGAAVAEYMMGFPRAFPDASWEGLALHECDDTAIDEGWFVGTHTAPLSSPDGDIAPTNRRVRLRECDVLTVQDGVAVSHRFYFDQLDFLTQLGLATAAGEPRGSDAAGQSG
jgi:ketosteroid isomerase-like protein